MKFIIRTNNASTIRCKEAGDTVCPQSIKLFHQSYLIRNNYTKYKERTRIMAQYAYASILQLLLPAYHSKIILINFTY